MAVIRTPEECFSNIPDFPYTPRYLEIEGKRIHYIDEGEGPETLLCLHGEPTWAFLYRKMIPIFLEAGFRVVAFDFLGFGRSDKLTERDEYSFQMHFDTMVKILEGLDLKDLTSINHDWGGVIGLPVAAFHPDRFKRLVILNTFLPTGEEPVTEGFLAWRKVAETKELSASRSVQNGTKTDLPQEVLDAYDAPFPDANYKAGMQVFPLLVPLSPKDPGAAKIKEARTLLAKWEKPAVVLFAPSDPVLGAAQGFFKNLIPTEKDQPRKSIWKADHFLQEDKGEEVAHEIIAFVGRT